MGSCASSYDPSKTKFNYSFSSKKPGFGWLCLPTEIEADILKPESEINPNTKLVIILNVMHLSIPLFT